jgi:hypothetical protein
MHGQENKAERWLKRKVRIKGKVRKRNKEADRCWRRIVRVIGKVIKKKVKQVKLESPWA